MHKIKYIDSDEVKYGTFKPLLQSGIAMGGSIIYKH
jgi:hypothetical protein